MSKYTLAPLADKDMEEIWDYTDKKWNEKQADKYTYEIREQFEGLLAFPNKGKPCDGVCQGRILHKSMDIDKNILH